MKIGDEINVYEFLQKDGTNKHVGLKTQKEAFLYMDLRSLNHIRLFYKMKITRIK